MTTARSLITRAMRKARVLARGETLTAEEANDALEDLNSMLGLWSNDNMLIVARVLEGFQLTAGNGQYTIGNGADFDTSRPMFISSAFIRDGESDHKVTVVSDAAFSSIASKNETGIPRSLNYSNANPVSTLRLWPRPTSGYTLYLWSEKEITSIATLDTVLSFPPGWEDAILYNLVVRFAPEYGQEPDPLHLKFANDGRDMIARTIRRNMPMDWNAVSAPGNVYTGWK